MKLVLVRISILTVLALSFAILVPDQRPVYAAAPGKLCNGGFETYTGDRNQQGACGNIVNIFNVPVLVYAQTAPAQNNNLRCSECSGKGYATWRAADCTKESMLATDLCDCTDGKSCPSIYQFTPYDYSWKCKGSQVGQWDKETKTVNGKEVDVQYKDAKGTAGTGPFRKWTFSCPNKECEYSKTMGTQVNTTICASK